MDLNFEYHSENSKECAELEKEIGILEKSIIINCESGTIFKVRRGYYSKNHSSKEIKQVLLTPKFGEINFIDITNSPDNVTITRAERRDGYTSANLLVGENRYVIRYEPFR